MKILAIERALAAAGVPFQRTFDWKAGWSFEVEGQVVAQGGAIGLLDSAMRAWWRTNRNAVRARERRLVTDV